MTLLNETHDPSLRSWVASANAAGNDFPLQNLPFAVFRRKGSGEAFRGGVAIGDQILDLAAAAASGAFTGVAATAAQHARPCGGRQCSGADTVRQGEPDRCRARDTENRDGRESHAPAQMPADQRADGQAKHRGHRPAKENEGDGAPAMLGRHQQAGAGSRLWCEDGRRNHREHAHRQQGAEARHQRAEDVPGGVPEQGEGEELPAVPARDSGGQQRGAYAHHRRGGRDELPCRGGRDRERGTDLVERAGHDHHARADHEVADEQRPERTPGRRLAHRRTCSAPGFTMFVGLPLM